VNFILNIGSVALCGGTFSVSGKGPSSEVSLIFLYETIYMAVADHNSGGYKQVSIYSQCTLNFSSTHGDPISIPQIGSRDVWNEGQHAEHPLKNYRQIASSCTQANLTADKESLMEKHE
jgi:hypothetical protein